MINRKKALSILLAVLMVTMFLAACSGGDTSAATPTPNNSSSSSQSSSGGDDSQSDQQSETVKLTLLINEMGADSATDKYWPNPVAQEIFRLTNTEFDIQGVDDEKFKVLLSAGDLPDMIHMQNTSYHKQLIEGELVLNMNDYIQDYGQNILRYASDTVTLSQAFASNDTGNLYFLYTNAGVAAPAYRPTFAYYTRWDLYKELGYPEINNELDFVDMLADMIKLWPETEEGKPVYGLGFSNEWVNGLWHWMTDCQKYGYFYTSTYECVSTLETHQLIANWFGDDSAPFWRTMKYANRAHQLGILDPESLTMTVGDFYDKAVAGQYLADNVSFWTTIYNGTALEYDPSTIRGFQALPVAGSSVAYDNFNAATGSGKSWGISANTKYPERCMELLDWFYTPEAARMAYSGVEGLHWTYVDGVPMYTEDSLANLNDPEWTLSQGIWHVGFGNMAGLSQGTVLSDGIVANLRNSPAMLSKTLEDFPGDRDFCDYYGVQYPMQAIDNMIKQGKMKDGSTTASDIGALMGSPPDDINRIQNTMLDVVARSLSKLVFANSDAEYEAAAAQVRAEMADAGAQKSVDWWQEEWNRVKTALGK